MYGSTPPPGGSRLVIGKRPTYSLNKVPQNLNSISYLNFKVRFDVINPPSSPMTVLTNFAFASLPRLSHLWTDVFVHLATYEMCG